jgi:hypothetical protein
MAAAKYWRPSALGRFLSFAANGWPVFSAAPAERQQTTPSGHTPARPLGREIALHRDPGFRRQSTHCCRLQVWPHETVGSLIADLALERQWQVLFQRLGEAGWLAALLKHRAPGR